MLISHTCVFYKKKAAISTSMRIKLCSAKLKKIVTALLKNKHLLPSGFPRSAPSYHITNTAGTIVYYSERFPWLRWCATDHHLAVYCSAERKGSICLLYKYKQILPLRFAEKYTEGVVVKSVMIQRCITVITRHQSINKVDGIMVNKYYKLLIELMVSLWNTFD